MREGDAPAAQARGLHFGVFAVAVAFAFKRLRIGPFEGPAIVKPLALAEQRY
jgi:hypothetical protein